MKRCLWLVVACGWWLAGCNRDEAPSPSSTSLTAPLAMPSLGSLNHGAQLFQEHCAQCHGPEAQGHPDWQTPGVVAAPPLNGTGNDWKRSRAQLIAIIRDGTRRNGEPVMPGWKGRLSDADIDDIVAWLQALWPPDVYLRWQRTHGSNSG
ncbi:MAG: c-type cytochrome [Sulfurifustaceae bacterium]